MTVLLFVTQFIVSSEVVWVVWMVQPQDLTQKDWEDIRDIYLEVSRYLDEVVAHQRSQWQVTTVLSPYAQEQARRVERTSPPTST